MGVRSFGITGPVALKSDNEEAVKALRSRVHDPLPDGSLF